jgi:hypothetical protein
MPPHPTGVPSQTAETEPTQRAATGSSRPSGLAESLGVHHPGSN